MANLRVSKEEMDEFMNPETVDNPITKTKLKVINDDYPKVQERVKQLEERVALESIDAGKFRVIRDELVWPK